MAPLQINDYQLVGCDSKIVQASCDVYTCKAAHMCISHFAYSLPKIKQKHWSDEASQSSIDPLVYSHYIVTINVNDCGFWLPM